MRVVLVVVYPTTLSTVPPAVKGWIERVLVPGVRSLVVAAHPCPESYVAAVCDRVVAGLAQAVETGLPSVTTLVTVTTLGGSRLANRLGGE
jgi:putative NADPH-quinone reductase